MLEILTGRKSYDRSVVPLIYKNTLVVVLALSVRSYFTQEPSVLILDMAKRSFIMKI